VARRNRNKHDRLGQAFERVSRRLDKTPLSCIGNKLQDFVRDVQKGLAAGQVTQEQANKLADYLEGFIERLPQSFGDRFRFDAGMIAAIAEEWNAGGTQLSTMLLPRPSADWGHQSVAMPTYSEQAAHVIDLILMPGDDNLDDIDLLAYPFLGHEMGHNALFKHEAIFSDAFGQRLQQHVNAMLRQSLADRGTAKVKAKEIIEQTRKVWSATPNHFNWAHEIAVDLIALWTCGPAYLATLNDVLDDPQVDPYQVGQSHPPYEVRARALIQAASELGWSAQCHNLSEAIQKWTRSEWHRGRNNQYAALASPSLVAACTDTALKTCEVLCLPKCTPDTVQALRQKLARSETPDLGTELILAACLVRENNDEPAYVDWERRVVRAHLEDITL
jgi:hypothetical protein